MATYLTRIVDAHRRVAFDDRRPLDHLIEQAKAAPEPRGFRAALADRPGLSVIAEIKRRSPSKGDLQPGLDPAALAAAYEAGGAAALSVLTDVEFFGGSAEDLRAARAATRLPVLRKDFTVSLRDVCDARIMGADAILLIVAALTGEELRDLRALGKELGLDVLVEVHDEHELDVAIALGTHLVGVNQRNLTTFEVDHERAVRMAATMPADVVKVAESGVRGADDARALRDVGYDAVLVGEALVTSPDPTATIRALRGET